MPVPEAPLAEAPGGGLQPVGDGWFIVNVADAKAMAHDFAGTYVPFEGPDHRFSQAGINIHVLNPGEPNGKYHGEEIQEGFLVLHGEALLIVEEQERTLRTWDFVHFPPNTRHIVIGAGDGPCAVLMFGARVPDYDVVYPVNESAARYGASALRETTDPSEAYSDWSSEFTPTRLQWPLG